MQVPMLEPSMFANDTVLTYSRLSDCSVSYTDHSVCWGEI